MTIYMHHYYLLEIDNGDTMDITEIEDIKKAAVRRV